MELKSVLKDLRAFVNSEHKANLEKIIDYWEQPLNEKILKGYTQKIKSIKLHDNNHLEATLGDNDSRFREGDMLCLHLGEAHIERHIQQAVIEAENEGSWLLRVDKIDSTKLTEIISGCYADADTMDLRSFYDKALDEIAESNSGRKIILPLIANQLNTGFIDEDRYDYAADYAETRNLNDQQSDAVGKGVAAEYVACIQGPPGTGKTKVISIIARLLVEAGERVLMTSHTHMAINNALNKIAEENVPAIKVGAKGGTKSLNDTVKHYTHASLWEDMPTSGYVIGATPFATCTERLESYDFDTIIFDEASQITLPLALMAMRKGKRFIFVGDHKQLPPVILSKSILSDSSVFSKMIFNNKENSTLLSKTYRMSKELTEWPSKTYYGGALTSEREREESGFLLKSEPKYHKDILSNKHPFVFIKTPNKNARNFNLKEAELVASIIETAVDAGLNPEDIGVVTPYRSHAKKLKLCLQNTKIGIFNSKLIVTDTVERMQGQEREMIIISLCSSDPQYLSAVAKFFFQFERLNVAITRPKTKLIIVGPELSDSFLSDTDDEQLKKNIEDYRSLIRHSYYVA